MITGTDIARLKQEARRILIEHGNGMVYSAAMGQDDFTQICKEQMRVHYIYDTIKECYSTLSDPEPPEPEYGDVKMGFLYNWDALFGAKQLLADGFEIPSADDFVTLLESIGDVYVDGESTSSIVGGKIKDPEYWTDVIPATNITGLSIRGAGYRSYGQGMFGTMLLLTYIWSTYMSTTSIFNVDRDFGGGAISVIQRNYVEGWRKAGLSVRGIKTSTTLSEGETGQYIGNDGRVYPTICIGGYIVTGKQIGRAHV